MRAGVAEVRAAGRWVQGIAEVRAGMGDVGEGRWVRAGMGEVGKSIPYHCHARRRWQ